VAGHVSCKVVACFAGLRLTDDKDGGWRSLQGVNLVHSTGRDLLNGSSGRFVGGDPAARSDAPRTSRPRRSSHVQQYGRLFSRIWWTVSMVQRQERHFESTVARAREWRERRGWSQARVARAAGLTQASVSNYETGRRDPTLLSALRIASALDVALGDLMDPALDGQSPDPVNEDAHSEARLVGRRARDWRVARGLSQARVARAAGLSQPTLSAYEAGKRQLRLTAASRLAAALEISLHDLTNGVPPPHTVGQSGEGEPAIGRRARAWRMKRGLSQARLGELTNLTSKSLSNYETGKRELSLASALRLAAALDITLDDLIPSGRSF
jgi:transcriptional regulator with XRE-family HTH domain